MKKNIVITVFSFFFLANLSAQERFHLSQYGANQEYFNPAVIASYDAFNVGLLWRNQWNGVNGAAR